MSSAGTSFDDIGLKDLENLVHVFSVLDVQVDGLGEIQGENTHDGLGIYDITSGDEIEIVVELGDVIDERLDLIDGVEGNRNSFHNHYPFLLCKNG